MSYRQIFDEAIGETPPSGIDVDRVVRRQRRAAKVRPALATLAVVLVVAAGTGTAFQLTRSEEEPPAQDPADLIVSFPEYQDGTRVFVTEVAPMADRTVSLTFTPHTLDIVPFIRCAPEPPEGFTYHGEFEAGDLTQHADICSAIDGSDVAGPADIPDLWESGGVEVGEEVSITLRLYHEGFPTIRRMGEGDPPSPFVGDPLPSPFVAPPAEGTLGLAVAELVPFEEYPLPPRPEVLAPLREVPGFEVEPGDIELRADPADPNARVTTTVTWDESLVGCGWGVETRTLLVSQTPGSLRVLVDGVELDHGLWWWRDTWWDYEQRATQPSGEICDLLEPGEQVTIAVEPEHMTGDWQFLLKRLDG